jgi:acyl-CoA reductase-like NAD-dependent aldehyde dehydrogenase
VYPSPSSPGAISRRACSSSAAATPFIVLDAEHLERTVDAAVWINRQAASRPELPYGGTTRSGYGRELGAAGIEEFANRKLICAVAPDARVGGFAG